MRMRCAWACQGIGKRCGAPHTTTGSQLSCMHAASCLCTGKTLTACVPYRTAPHRRKQVERRVQIRTKLDTRIPYVKRRREASHGFDVDVCRREQKAGHRRDAKRCSFIEWDDRLLSVVFTTIPPFFDRRPSLFVSVDHTWNGMEWNHPKKVPTLRLRAAVKKKVDPACFRNQTHQKSY
jgi:hypothetical protein